MIRFNGLEREYQKKNIDINNNNILVLKNKPKNKMKLEPIDQRILHQSNKSMFYKNKNRNNNKFINIYENNFELDNNKNNINDRYDLNMKREEEARKDILKNLNLKFNNNNNDNINNNSTNISEVLFPNKNNKNKNENKYTWDMLSNMKSNNLVNETELNSLIN